MAKLNNVLSKIFGSGAGLNQISKFGSLFAGTPGFTTDPAEAQSLSNYLTGWAAAAIGSNSPAIEDMNAVLFAITYQLAYYQQSGIPEWNSGKTYYIGSLVNDGNGAIYVSKIDNNLNNLLSDTASWTKVAGKVMTALGDLIYGGVDGAMTALGGNTTTQKQFLTQTGTGSGSAAPVWQDFKPPTIQKFTSGSGTYTKPSGVLYIKVRMVGGGGGGGGSGSSGIVTNGGTGGDTIFGNLTANGGTGGTQGNGGGGGVPGAGGASSIGAGFSGTSISGSDGGPGSNQITTLAPGGNGGSSAFGGGGSGGTATAANPNPGKTNSGSGGGGAGSATSAASAGGGGAGGFIEAIADSPSATYSYSVGSAGSSGSGGTGTGGAVGAAGYIEVTEYYQ